MTVYHLQSSSTRSQRATEPCGEAGSVPKYLSNLDCNLEYQFNASTYSIADCGVWRWSLWKINSLTSKPRVIFSIAELLHYLHCSACIGSRTKSSQNGMRAPWYIACDAEPAHGSTCAISKVLACIQTPVIATPWADIWFIRGHVFLL